MSLFKFSVSLVSQKAKVRILDCVLEIIELVVAV